MKNKILEKILCNHIEYCMFRKTKKMNHENVNCNKLYAKANCKEYKNYEKYGEDYNELGVGS